VSILIIVIPIGARCFYGPFPFFATFVIVQLIKSATTVVLGIANVTVVLQLLFIIYFE
jgi:hypothetical protein